MKLPLSIAALLTAAALLASCATPIEYGEITTETTSETSAPEEAPQVTEEAEPEKVSKDLYSPSDFVVAKAEYDETYQLEFNTDAYSYTEGLSGYNGSGFICLGNKDYATIKITVPSSQHYKIGLRVCSTGSKLAVITGGDGETDSADGTYTTYNGTAAGGIYVDESVAFNYYYLDSVYLSKGENNVTIQSLSGIAYLDEISVKNSETVPELAYAVSTACINKNATDNTKTVKKYLADVYGNRVITGQFCTPGTNTELNAVYMDTGRYSAIRFGDIGIYSDYYDGIGKNSETELQNAKDWWKSGGIVGYTWYWYAPSEEKPHYYLDLTDFSLSKAATDVEAADLDAESLSAYEQTGRISRSCYSLIRDIDSIAAKLKLLAAEDIPVLFRPLPEAGNGWYWWGEDAESYLWLYKLIYNRLTGYHELNNLIWVWNGESAAYYPGDAYVDIVGMDVYSDSDISANSRMLDAIHYTINTKPCALTECGKIPNPDIIARDNALWLWFALWRGDYIINEDGSISYEHVTAKELDYAYNNELYITRDELPDFSRYY